MSTLKHQPPADSPSEEQYLRNLTKSLIAYTQTPEGMQKMNDVSEFMDRLNPPKQSSTISLTKQEKQAMQFIRKELKNKRVPSVRGITKAIDLRSSRSGHRVLQGLISKGVLGRDGGYYTISAR